MKWISFEQDSPHCYSHVLLTNGKKIWVETCFEDHGGWSDEDYPTHFIYINELQLPDGNKIRKKECEKSDCHCDSQGCSYLPVEPDYVPFKCSECKEKPKIVTFTGNHMLERQCLEHWNFKTITPFQVKDYYIEAYNLHEIIKYFEKYNIKKDKE